jgi:hypothetical protein
MWTRVPLDGSQARAKDDKYARVPLPLVSVIDHANERAGEKAQSNCEPDAQADPAKTQGNQRKEREPNEVELLLYSQQPVVLQRRRRKLSVEIFRSLRCEMQVGHKHRSRRRAAGHGTGDQEPRQHAEDVHAHIAALDARDTGMKRDDKEDSHGPQPLNIPSIVTVPPRNARPIWQSI